jgi:hypothetical protein
MMVRMLAHACHPFLTPPARRFAEGPFSPTLVVCKQLMTVRLFSGGGDLAQNVADGEGFRTPDGIRKPSPMQPDRFRLRLAESGMTGLEQAGLGSCRFRRLNRSAGFDPKRAYEACSRSIQYLQHRCVNASILALVLISAPSVLHQSRSPKSYALAGLSLDVKRVESDLTSINGQPPGTACGHHFQSRSLASLAPSRNASNFAQMTVGCTSVL